MFGIGKRAPYADDVLQGLLNAPQPLEHAQLQQTHQIEGPFRELPDFEPKAARAPGPLGDNKLMILGAMLRDMGAGLGGGQGNALTSLHEQQAARADQARKLALREKAQEALATLSGNPNAGRADFLSAFGPLLAEEGNLSALAGMFPKAADPEIRDVTGVGLVRVGSDGKPEVLVKAPEKQRNAPAGFDFNDDGSLKLIPGYADGIGQLGGVRRDAIVSRPMPRAPARGRSGGGGPTWLPAGARVIGQAR